MSVLNARIVEAIATTGCYVGASVLDADLLIALRARVRTLYVQQRLRLAQIGRGATLSSTTQWRGDTIAWLDQDALDPAEARAIEMIDLLRGALNEALYIGAIDFEGHYARYPRGACYRTHLDRFGDNDLRVISLVFYLNARWHDEQGGELLVYDSCGRTIERVLPRCGTMVAFLSDQFPHEVLPATRPRLALSGWLRRRALPGH